MAEVFAWLVSHGVAATVVPPDRTIALEFTALARRLGGGLIMAGGHGHSRNGRRVLGGITSELLAWRHLALMSA